MLCIGWAASCFFRRSGPWRKSRMSPTTPSRGGRSPAAARQRDTIESVVAEFMKRYIRGRKHSARYVVETQRNFDKHVQPRWRDRDMELIRYGLGSRQIRAHRTLAWLGPPVVDIKGVQRSLRKLDKNHVKFSTLKISRVPQHDKHLTLSVDKVRLAGLRTRKSWIWSLPKTRYSSSGKR